MLIFSTIVAIFVYGMISAMLGTILPDLSDRFGLSPRQNGTIAFAQALGLIIASLGVGPLLDNEGKKLGLIIGLALIAIALFALPRSSGFRSIVFVLFLLGVGGGIVVTGANALVSDVGEAHRGAALNMVNLFFGLGGWPHRLSQRIFLVETGFASATPSRRSRSFRSPSRHLQKCRSPLEPVGSCSRKRLPFWGARCFSCLDYFFFFTSAVRWEFGIGCPVT